MVSPNPAMFSYDPSLLAVVQTKPQSISDVLRILHVIDSTCDDRDGLKWFNRLYLQVTEAIVERLAAGDGEFANPEWLRQLDVQFARLYFSALQSSLSEQATPSCWQVMFKSRDQSSIARIQYALAGVNAHINHDLPEAIVATCQITSTTPDEGGTLDNEYTALNSTLDQLVESAKLTLSVRLLGDSLPPVSHLEDVIAAWNVSAARESAWDSAQQLWLLRTTPALSSSFMGVLDGFTTVINKVLLVPVP
jgi:hypothetical protein